MKQEFMDHLLSINPHYNMEPIEKAYNIAEQYHEGQMPTKGTAHTQGR